MCRKIYSGKISYIYNNSFILCLQPTFGLVAFGEVGVKSCYVAELLKLNELMESTQ